MYQIYQRLPTKLIDAIIDISARDMETLQSLSVMSKNYLPRCRMHIFRSIVFSADYGEDVLAERHETFLSILARDPGIQTYVRELSIEDRIDSSSCASLPWIMTNVRFHETLYLLGSHLENFCFISQYYNWDQMSTSLKLSLMTIFASPLLKSMTLIGLENMPRACCVAIGSHIQKINMMRVDLSDRVDPDLPMMQAITPPSLEWLCLEDIHQQSINILLDAWIPAPAQGHDRPLFPRLGTLSIGPTDEDDVGPLWELAQGGRASMTNFLWEYRGTRLMDPLNSRPLDLSTLKRLREICYEITAFPHSEVEDGKIVHIVNRPNDFDGLLSLLQTVEQMNDIRQVFIRVNLLTLSDAMQSLKKYNGWDRLNSVLESERFVHLQELALHLDVKTERMFGEHVDVDLSEKRMELETLVKEHVPVLLRYIGSDPEAFVIRVMVEGQLIVLRD